MKLHSVLLVFVFGVVGLAGTVSSMCLVKNTARPKVYLYQCFMSTDYLADVKKAPIDIPRVSFTNSKITVIKNGSFTRLSKYLERLVVFHCGVEDIEDDAFQGLTKLDAMGFEGNKLRVIKSAWFKGLSNLKEVHFPSNQIKHVEDSFFSILPPLESLDISMNEITCLPTSSFGNFKADEFHFRQNRLRPMCQVLLMNWLTERNVRYNDNDLDFFDPQYDVTKVCLNKLPKPQLDEESLDKCIEKTMSEVLPVKGNYTIKEMCDLLKDTSSPFMDCTSV